MGGESDTEVNELTVVATACSPDPLVITVTPVTKRPHTFLSMRGSTGTS